ncbi:MAG TPA: winged helix-turn-helix domain-containing protein [Candidatus Bathyarchaeia archaeon]|nr:winged helix-turn-helix domain-containing protein [Candidatus Bathyarchaeia archaeon]
MRRSREEILFGILKSCAYDRLSVYQIMISQNLSYKLLKSCLDRLAKSKLVSLDVEERRKVVGTTRAGLDALKHYRNALSLLHEKF